MWRSPPMSKHTKCPDWANPNAVKVTVQCGRWSQTWLCDRANAIECLQGTLRFLDRVEPLPQSELPLVGAAREGA